MSYKYSQLPSSTHTRLLELQPSEDPTSELRCRIHVVNVHDTDTPFYEAISYTWGTNTLSHVLVVEGATGEAATGEGSKPVQLAITQSLFEALVKFRDHAKPRFLWADAVCISQNDDDEKSKHIPLMTDIYRGATRVLVWLGSGRAEEGMVSRTGALGRLTRMSSHALSAGQLQELHHCFLGLLRLPWFSRRWIIQEVVMNSDVMLFCGNREVSFLRLVQVATFLAPARNDQEKLKGARSLLTMFDMWKRWTFERQAHSSAEAKNTYRRRRRDSDNEGLEETTILLRLLMDFDHFGCADGRDYIFTLAALAEDVSLQRLGDTNSGMSKSTHPEGWTNGEIVVDYSMSTEELYARTAQMISNGCEKLFYWILAQASARSTHADKVSADTGIKVKLPSWVPDWRKSIHRRPLWDLRREGFFERVFPAYEPYDLRTHDNPIQTPTFKHRIWRLGSSNVHLLRATFAGVEHWRSSVPAQYVDNQETYPNLQGAANTENDDGIAPDASVSDIETYWYRERHPVRWLKDPYEQARKPNGHRYLPHDSESRASKLTSTLEEHAIDPLAVTWKGPCFPDVDIGDHPNNPNVIEHWVRSAFEMLCNHIGYRVNIDANDRRAGEYIGPDYWSLTVFVNAITAHSRFLGELSLEQLAAITASRTFFGRPDPRPPGPNEGDFYDLVQSIILETGAAEKPPGIDAMLVLIALTMQGRTLFICEVDWDLEPLELVSTDDDLEPHDPFDIVLGIGPAMLELGDRVVAFPADSEDIKGLTRLYGTNTLLVRNTTLADDATQLNQVNKAVEELWRSHDRCTEQDCTIPIYEVVGDCVISTKPVGLGLSGRGLGGQEWDIENPGKDQEKLGRSKECVVSKFRERNLTWLTWDVILV